MAFAPGYALARRLRTLAAKFEAVVGTAETLAGTDAAFHIQNAVVQQVTEMEKRQMQNSFKQLAAVPGLPMGRLTGRLDFVGGSHTPAGLATFLPSVLMGLNTGGTAYVYNPIPNGGTGATSKTLTAASYQAGRVKQIHGAMGTARFTFPGGKICYMEPELTGLWDGVTTAAALAPTYPVLTPLKFLDRTITLGSYAGIRVSNVTIDLANAFELIGKQYVLAVAGEVVTVTIDPLADMNVDIYGDWASMTTHDLSFQITNGTDTCDVTASDVQMLDPKENERNGLEADQIGCQINGADLTFTFSQPS